MPLKSIFAWTTYLKTLNFNSKNYKHRHDHKVINLVNHFGIAVSQLFNDCQNFKAFLNDTSIFKSKFSKHITNRYRFE